MALLCPQKSHPNKNKGKSIWTPEQKKLISERQKGQRHSPETEFRKGLIPWNKGTQGLTTSWNKGQKYLQISGVKHPQWKGGKPRCKECETTLAAYTANYCTKHVRTGSRNSSWKGGVASFRDKIRKTEEHKFWRTSVFERDKYKCQMPNCDGVGKYLEAHHIKRFVDYPEIRFDVSNGITLCKKCHSKTLKKEGDFEKTFVEIICLHN